jgi:N5-(carboxyethyl)ornithine synthase
MELGFPIPTKENERRRALLPTELAPLRNRAQLVFEAGYGAPLGIPDSAYRSAGARVADRGTVCALPAICIPKPMLEDEYYGAGKLLFGWIHAVQGRSMTDLLLTHRMTAIAWEDMMEGGRHSFWRNNELSGEAAIYHAFLQWGRVPDNHTVAVIGRGNVARGALRVLERSGCNVTVYDRKTVGLLRQEIERYDVVVNAVLWDVFRQDHLLYAEDLDRMAPGSLIIDISCDDHMGIESSHSTTISDPIYWERGIMHYVVDHTPALCYRSASESISLVVARFLDDLLEGRPHPVLDAATVIRDGAILDERIIRFQAR